MALNIEGLGEPYFTLPHAAKELGLPVSLLRRAVNCGLVPSYRPFGQRVRVCLSEVVAVIASFKLLDMLYSLCERRV